MSYRFKGKEKDKLLILQKLEEGEEIDPSGGMGQLTELWLLQRQITSLPSSISRCSNLQHLDLSYNHLTHLPDSISQLKRLRSLHLWQNNFTVFPAQICSLKELETLDMSYNKLAILHPDVKKLANLKSLNLSSNKFTAFPAEVYHIPGLETLKMNRNNISSVHLDVMKMTKLRNLDLSENQFKEIPVEVCHIPELKTLQMNRNKISSVHPDIMKMTKLTNLDLGCNEFKEIPAEVCHIPELLTLKMNQNKISSVYPDVMKMTKLTNLDLSANQFTEFPTTICHIPDLETLNMERNRISSVHPDVMKMTKLTNLDLSANQFTEFPTTICHIPDLETLKMNTNNISSVHPDVMKMTKLTNLDLSENQFTDFPAEVCHIPELGTLKMNKNKISSIHPDVMKMIKLANLNLSCNEFKEIPAEICHIPELETLEMHGNKISSVHPDVMKMIKLAKLNLSCNEFKEIPAEICHIPELKTLQMNENKIDDVHPDVMKMSKLTNLELGHNHFTHFPKNICKIQSLKYLDMSYNWITHLPHQLLELEYLVYLRVQDNPLVPPLMTDLLGKEDIHHYMYLASMKVHKGLKQEEIFKGMDDDSSSSRSSHIESKRTSSFRVSKFKAPPLEREISTPRPAGPSKPHTPLASASSTTTQCGEELLMPKAEDITQNEFIDMITKELVPRQERKKMGAIIQRNCDELQKNFPNISYISISRGKSVEKKPCIAIYCSDMKNTSQIPKELGGYPVEVREGTFSLLADNEGNRDNDHSQLYIGCSVSSTSCKGSLGVFANQQSDHAPTKPQAFVTCSHVVCPGNENPEAAIGTPVFVENNQNLKKCGVVSKSYTGNVDYASGDGEVIPCGVDIALVQLHKNAQGNLFPIQSQETQFSDLGTKDICDLPDPVCVYKYGQTTGLTKGCVFAEYDYCKDPDIKDKKFENMISVMSNPTQTDKPFCKPGDSGSAVFVLENGKILIIGILVGARNAPSDIVQCSTVSRIHPSLYMINACIYKPPRLEEAMQTEEAPQKEEEEEMETG